VVISAVYMLRAYRAIFMGPPAPRSSTWPNESNSARILRWPALFLIAALFIVGFFPNTILHFLRPSLSVTALRTAESHAVTQASSLSAKATLQGAGRQDARPTHPAGSLSYAKTFSIADVR